MAYVIFVVSNITKPQEGIAKIPFKPFWRASIILSISILIKNGDICPRFLFYLYALFFVL